VKLQSVLVGLMLTVCLRVYAASPDAVHHWLDSFEAYKESIRALEPAMRERCVAELHSILETIDGNASCSADSDCTILNQDPFGATVPVRTETGKALLLEMQSFKASCDNNSMHSNQELAGASMPVCLQNRCLVKLVPRVR